jgi:hypothetical protein
MSKKQELVNFSVTSYEGDTEFSMLPKQAVAKIKQLEAQEQKWLFINGEHKNASLITEKDLIEAKEEKYEIYLMDALAGGNEMIVDIRVETIPKEDGISIWVETNDYAKIVTIEIGEKDIVETLHNREVIIKALEQKLDSLANQQVTDLKKALNL